MPPGLPARCCAASRIEQLVKSLPLIGTAAACLLLPLLALGQSNPVRIGVFGLFHPRQLAITPAAGQALIIHPNAEEIVLEKTSGIDSADIRLDGANALITVGRHSLHTPLFTITGRNREPVDFVLSVPGKLHRHYRGILTIKASPTELIAVVTMDRETAVASVLASETTAETPPEALKALAVVARSYFAAGRRRHRDFDFCDTTHCQFLRDAPPRYGLAAKAAEDTRGLVLAYDSRPVAAMYTRSCSGRTHTPADVGLPASNYPYFEVECKYCREHPQRWSRRIPAKDAVSLRPLDELARLKIGRKLGWSAVPGNDFTAQKEDDQIVLDGVGYGHGIGLCQSGSKAMALAGSTFRQILDHYFPNTSVVSAPSR